MMRKIVNPLVIIVLVFLVYGCRNKETNEPESSGSEIFQKIQVQESGLDFKNFIRADMATKENLFDFDYFYNGSGVGIADINNDGLQDVFFTGNQVQNRLYLNQGNLQFKDITEISQIDVAHKKWSNGVSFADINDDGYLDIYVSQGGPHEAPERKNLLFINNGNLTFTESADAYGLADDAISNQAAFFDYDKDGDLDCIIMNENPFYGVDPINFRKLLLRNKELRYVSSSHFYKNENGKFKDITLQSGIFKPTFGLGLAVSDINNDGWLDIYIANDYYLPDNLFINNGNGLFVDQIDEYTDQISFFGMGVDIADINNDLLNDIFVLDMASSDHKRSKTLMASMDVKAFRLLENYGFHTQYMFNSLQLNQGDNKFVNIAHLGDLAKTDWSWSVLMTDLNNDEYNDIYVTNGYRRYALDNDFKNQVTSVQRKYKGRVPIDVKKNLYYSMPSEKLSNLMYQNKGDLDFLEVASEWGLEAPSFSNGAGYGDLDNDGDLDMVINNMDENAFLYKNLTIEKKLGNYLRVQVKGELSESYARIRISYDGKKQFKELGRVRGYLSTSENAAHFGLGKSTTVDTICVEWLSGKFEERYNVSANTIVEFEEIKGVAMPAHDNIGNSVSANEKFNMLEPAQIGLDYRHSENDYDDFLKEVLLPYKQSTLGPIITEGDINGDGLTDLFIGSAQGQPSKLMINTGSRLEERNLSDGEMDAEDMGAVFLDFDKDGDKDIYVLTGGNEYPAESDNYVDRFYLNDGNNVFTRVFEEMFDQQRFSGKVGCAIDFNKDGYDDLLVANRIIPQSYPMAAPSFLYQNESGKQFKDVTPLAFPDLSYFGIVNDVIATDFNNDGWMDIILVGEWTHIGMFRNNNGVFQDVSGKSNLNEEKGWWFSIEKTDLNNDGLKDYVVGNVGQNIKFKASHKKPFKIYASDFDSTGTLDVVLSKLYNDEYVPVRGKECSTEQMPFISQKYRTYNDYADASIEDIYGEKLGEAYTKEATTFSSTVLFNKGGGYFEIIKLPILAQLFPVLDIISDDFNGDGFEDVLLAGNIFDTEVETPRWDANSGLILYSNQNNGYESGYSLNINGDVKSLSYLEVNNQKVLIAGRNNATLAVYVLDK